MTSEQFWVQESYFTDKIWSGAEEVAIGQKTKTLG
jgi:hypothetical protein